MRLSRRWLLVAVAAYIVLAALLPLVYGAMADMEAPFSEAGTTIWTVVIPGASVIIAAFAIWLAVRAGHGGLVMAFVGVLLFLYLIGALPQIAQDAGLEWPF